MFPLCCVLCRTAAGFSSTKFVLPDIAGELPVAILDDLEKHADYSAAVDILGVHYCGDAKCAHSERVASLGKEIWMTEGQSVPLLLSFYPLVSLLSSLFLYRSGNF
eukprot:COSAG06_NODE_2112_length_7564_cov_4.547354_8_plen_106_part_00